VSTADRNVNPNGRYYGVPTQTVDGVLELDVRARPRPQSYNFRKYYTREGERLDLMGLRFLQNGSQWWRLADINDDAFPLPKPGSTFRVYA
jgi:hypothetical protein